MIASAPIAAPDTPEWHVARSQGIGASEAAAACGLSRWELPLEVWSRKVHGHAKEANDAMILGNLMEPVVAAMFERKTTHIIEQASPGLYRHPEIDWMLATPDALLADGTLAEFKTTTSRNGELGEEESDEVPIEWLCQAQQQMAVTGAPAVRFGVLIDGREFREFVVERHSVLIERLIVRESELWHHIKARVPPPLDFTSSHAARAARDAFRSVSEGEVINLDASAEERWNRSKEITAAIKALEAEQDAIKAEATMLMGHAQTGLFPSGASLRRTLIAGASVSYERSPYVRLSYRKG